MSVMPCPVRTPSRGCDGDSPGSCGHGVCQLLSEPRSIVPGSPQDVSALQMHSPPREAGSGSRCVTAFGPTHPPRFLSFAPSASRLTRPGKGGFVPARPGLCRDSLRRRLLRVSV